MAFEIITLSLINKHDVVFGIKDDWKIVVVESFRVSEKERVGILESVNL